MAPSNTELIYSLNAEDKLVGVCNQCDQPAAVKTKATVGSFVSLNLEKLAKLHPKTIFLVDGQEGLAEIVAHQSFLQCRAVVLRNSKVLDVASNLEAIGKYTGQSQRAAQLAAVFRQQVCDLRKQACRQDKRPRVFLCLQALPLITVGKGSYLDDAITVCGGTNVAGGLPNAYAQYGIEQLIAAQPDVVILPHEAAGEDFWRKPPWTALKAVANKRLYFLPPRDADHLSRPTLRLLDGLRWLAARLHE